VTKWIEEQIASFYALSRSCVIQWHGIEMALRDANENGLPDFRDSSVPFLQLRELNLTFVDGSTASINTYQNNDCFGLCCKNGSLALHDFEDDPNSIYRLRLFDELPKGQILDVSVSLNRGDIEEVKLMIEKHEVRLCAGEVYENNDLSLHIMTMDESVLMQVDGKHPDLTNCNGEKFNA
jgi:hypothetical protein